MASPRHNSMVTLTSIQVRSMRTQILRYSQPEHFSTTMVASAFRSFLLPAVRPATAERRTTYFLRIPRSAPCAVVEHHRSEGRSPAGPFWRYLSMEMS